MALFARSVSQQCPAVIIFLDLQRQQRIMGEFQKSVETAERGARIAQDAGAPKMAAKFRAIACDFAKADKILEG